MDDALCGILCVDRMNVSVNGGMCVDGVCIVLVVDKMGNEDFVKKVYLGSVEGTNRRGRPLGRWKDRVKEYVSERGVRGNGLEWARREYMDRERWKSV